MNILLWLQRLCTNFAFQRSNKWLIGFRSRLCAGHVCCTLFATTITNVLLAAWHGANNILRLSQIWSRRTNRMTSVRYLIAFMFPAMVTLAVFMCMEQLWRILLCLLLPYLMFFNQQGIRSYQIKQLLCCARGAQAQATFAPTVDALIKYVT